jgi:hypothetical protein
LKNSILISAIILLFTIQSFGQTEEYIPVHSFGIRQGINMSSVSFGPGVKQGTTLGYTGGFVYKYQNEKNFALQLELNYTQKGWTEKLDSAGNSYSRKLNYIELPFITHIVMGKRPKMKIYLNLGTSFAYFLSEQEDMKISYDRYKREYYEKEVENYFDCGGLGELGLLLNTKIGSMQVGVRYQLSFTDIFKTTEETIYTQSQNQFWNLSLSYFFLDNKK